MAKPTFRHALESVSKRLEGECLNYHNVAKYGTWPDWYAEGFGEFGDSLSPHLLRVLRHHLEIQHYDRAHADDADPYKESDVERLASAWMWAN